METDRQFSIKWVDGRIEPKVRANPAYPRGRALDSSSGAPQTCTAQVPYPARRIGFYVVECRLCGRSVAMTTAGRADDPVSVKIACDLKCRRAMGNAGPTPEAN